MVTTAPEDGVASMLILVEVNPNDSAIQRT